jgi:serine phosphatase RsbU (regulator of sigma subunit)
MIYAQLRTTAAGPSLCLLNCGHPAALVMRAKGPIEEVAGCGPLLGQFPKIVVEPAALALRPGDVLVLVTDGVLEARGPRSRAGATHWFGSEGLRLAMAESRGESAATITRRIEERAVSFSDGSLKDDLAILALRAL